MAVVNELITKFTFQGSLKPLKKFQEDLKGSIVELGKYGLALGATTLAAALWADNTLKGAETLVRLSQDTDLTIERLQELEYIASQNGVSADTFANSIGTLSDKIGEAATQGSEDFNRLGISIRDADGNIRTTEDVLGDLTSKFQGLSQTQQINFANKLGIDQNLITAFNKTDAELEQLTKTAGKFGLITTEQTKELDKYYASVESLKFGFTAVSRQVALQFAPTIDNMSKNIVGFLGEFGQTFAEVFGEFFEGIGKLLSAFNSVIEATVGWKVVLIAFGAALSVAFPIIPIIAGIGLLLVALEDIITAFDSGKSVIKDFFTDTFGIDIVKELTAAFEVLGSWVDILTDKFLKLVDFFSSAGKKIKDLFSAVVSFFGGNNKIEANVNQNVQQSPQPLQQSNVRALQALPTNNTNMNSNTNTMTNDIKIEVKSNDPEAAGLAVSTALNRELENASFQFNKNSGR